MTEFRNGVLAGDWARVEKLLLQLPPKDVFDTTVRPLRAVRRGLSLTFHPQTIRFELRQQRFLEALEAKETKKALAVLRNELAPLNHDSDRLHFLSRRVVAPLLLFTAILTFPRS